MVERAAEQGGGAAATVEQATSVAWSVLARGDEW